MAILYRELASQPFEIRLMELLPADHIDASILCRLVQFPLTDAPPYETLSYTWGDPSNTSEAIKVDSVALQITWNLETALRYIRHPTSKGPRLLWVDALCINQNNLLERSSQVTAMKDIYENSVGNLAWLGLDVDAAYEPVSLRRMSEGLDLLGRICKHDISTLKLLGDHNRLDDWRRQKYSQDLKRKGTMIVNFDESQLLHRVLGCKFWDRIWIMQELAVAPSVTLFVGHSTLDWESVEAFMQDQPYADAFHVPWGHGRLHKMTGALFSRIKRVRDQRGLTQRAESEESLMDVMARFRRSAATDPRDRVYALLGLVSPGHGISVDYRKPVHRVFTDATRAMINSCGNLDMLCQNPWSSQVFYETMPLLPSWATNFSHNNDELRKMGDEDRLSGMIFAQRGIFSAGKPSCDVPCQVSDDGALTTKGCIIGHVGSLMTVDITERRRWAKLITLARQWWRHYGLAGKMYETTAESSRRAFWRTLLFDCRAYPMKRLEVSVLEQNDQVFEKEVFSEELFQSSRAEERSSRGAYQADNEDSSDDSCEEDRYELYDMTMFVRNCEDWDFCVSDNGLYTMLPGDAKAGDLLVVLDGAKVPVVLRQDGKDKQSYRLVGGSYVHGYMDGLVEEHVHQGLLSKQELMIV